jgi:hypothetical protein
MAGVSNLAVWVANGRAGLLERQPNRKYVFAYHPEFEEIGIRMIAAWDEGLNGLMK